MAEPSEKGDYVSLTGVKIWWTPGQPDEIHLTADDPDLTHPNTGPGMRVVFSTNVKSANYHPANFNRCREILLKYGKSAPSEAGAEGNRRLDKRPGFGASQPVKSYVTKGDEGDGPYDVQVYRPEPDPSDLLTRQTGSVFALMGWLNMFGEMRVEAFTAVPMDDGGPPTYVVVWRKP